MCLVGLAAGVAESPALAQQIPAEVELDPHLPKPPLIFFEPARVLGVCRSLSRRACSSATRLSIRAAMLSSLIDLILAPPATG